MNILHNLHSIDILPNQRGVTVRLGDIWQKKIKEGGPHIKLCECRDNKHFVVGKGFVEDLWYGRFSDLPARLIEDEHEESSRLYSGLLSSMRRAYGNKFNEDDMVTVISYLRTE